MLNQIGRQCRQPIIASLRPSVLDDDIPSIDVAGLLEPREKSLQRILVRLGRRAVEKADYRGMPAGQNSSGGFLLNR